MNEKVEEVLRACCIDGGCYPFVIDPAWGKDITIPNHLDLFIDPPSEPRCIITITSFAEYTAGAKHYYVTIDADGPRLCWEDEGEVKWMVGYVCKEWDEMPKEVKDRCKGLYTVIVRRRVTAADVAADPIRWEGYDVGDYTDAFESKEAAVALAVHIARLRFPKYKIEITDQTL